MKRKIPVLLALIMLCCVLMGCSKDLESNLALGTYVLQEENELPRPYVNLQKDNKFVFTYSLFSSYLPMGTYEITDNQLILKADDNKYVFGIDGDAIIFNAQSSSKIPFGEVLDGSIFIKEN